MDLLSVETLQSPYAEVDKKQENTFNSLPNDNSKLTVFAEDKLNVAVMMISLIDRVEKHCAKRRKCWLPAFSPFPTVFSKASFFRVVKSRDCVIKHDPTKLNY